MTDESALTCRGCYTKLKNDEIHSFVWPEIKELFEDCTRIKILPDQRELPQQICSECLSQCEQWNTFKTMCQDVDQHLQSKLNPPNEPEIQPKDVSMVEQDSPEQDECLDEDDLGTYNFGVLIADEEESEEDSHTKEINHQDQEKDVPDDKSTDWKCPVCSTLLPESVLLRDHLKEHYSENDPRCPICSEIFTRASKVYPHVISVHLENKGKVVIPKKTSKPTPNRSPDVKKKDSLKPCPVCKKRFRELHKHIYDAHTNRLTPECPICKKPAQFRSYLKGHILFHTGELPFSCPLCPLKFPIVGRLNKHTRQVHGHDKMTVDKVTDNTPSMVHKKIKSPAKKTILKDTGHNSVEQVIVHPGLFQCPLCDKVATMSALRTHFVVHTDEKPFKCKYCEIDFTRKGSAVVHVRQFHPDKSPEKGFVLKKGSIFHSMHPWEEVGYHLQGSVTNTESKEAEKKTVRKENSPRKQKRIIRTKSTRQLSKPKCNQCKNHFSTNAQLRKHMTTHPPRDTHPYECGICGNTFCTVTHRRIHQVVHSDARPFPCSECTLHFKSNDHLKKHLQKSHSQTQEPKKGTSDKTEVAVLSVEQKSKSLTCPYCDKKYAQRKSFWTHMNQHREEEGAKGTPGEKCTLCELSFKNKGTYQQHLLRVHGVGDPQYKCKVCHKKFFKRTVLYSHQRSHEAVAPYPCKMCSKRFTYLTNLRRHVKSWHDQ